MIIEIPLMLANLSMSCGGRIENFVASGMMSHAAKQSVMDLYYYGAFLASTVFNLSLLTDRA